MSICAYVRVPSDKQTNENQIKEATKVFEEYFKEEDWENANDLEGVKQ